MQIEIKGKPPVDVKNAVLVIEGVTRSLCQSTGRDPAEGIMLLLTAAAHMGDVYMAGSLNDKQTAIARALGSAMVAADEFFKLRDTPDLPANTNTVTAAQTDNNAKASEQRATVIDASWIASFIEWNFATFGPGRRTEGTIDHIRKELEEIETDPADPKEWADIILLAINGLARLGLTPDEIIQTIVAKQLRNTKRTWPSWQTADPKKAVEHIREDRLSDGLEG
ncbi:dATP/dGTP pyrophosphohydrolase domain-containing protein [Brucella sp. TWI432]